MRENRLCHMRDFNSCLSLCKVEIKLFVVVDMRRLVNSLEYLFNGEMFFCCCNCEFFDFL